LRYFSGVVPTVLRKMRATDGEAAIFAKALSGGTVSQEEELKYKTRLLLFLGRLYADRGWAMQYHMNASRNNEAPDDFELLGGMVRNIGYFNAKHYFAFDRQKDGSERVAL